MKTLSVLGVAIAAVSLVSVASATTLDFEGLTSTFLVAGGDTVPAAASVLTDDFDSVGVVFGKAGVSAGVAVVHNSFAPSSGVNSVAGLDAAGVIPGTAGGVAVGDIFFQFVLPGTTTPATAGGISFTIGDAGGDTDIFQVRAYDIADALLSSQDLSGASRFPVSIPGLNVHRLEVDFTGDFGYSLDDLSFRITGGKPVPEGGSLLVVFALTVLASGMIASRKKRS